MRVPLPRQSLGTRIRRARERKRMSQEDLARALGVHRVTVGQWETDKASPRNSIGALEEILGVSLAEPEPEPEPEIDLSEVSLEDVWDKLDPAMQEALLGWIRRVRRHKSDEDAAEALRQAREVADRLRGDGGRKDAANGG